jgi:hypothetical protein
MKWLKVLALLAAWLLLCKCLGLFEVLHKRPSGMHQWAQCDRASIALNYSEESMDFFHPQVHDVLEGEGITGLEFPLMNYTAAIYYRLFGFNECWFRLLMWLVVSLGVWASYKIAATYLNSWAAALLLAMAWYCCPALVFYTPNFIPDAASLGLMMLGWWQFFKYTKKQKFKYFIYFSLFAALAGLIKITSLIGVVVVGAIWLVGYTSFLKKPDEKHFLAHPLKVFASLIAIGVVVTSWYIYASWLNNTYKAHYFIMSIVTPDSLFSLIKFGLYALYRWSSAWYSLFFYILLAASSIFMFIHRAQLNRLLVLVFSTYTMGAGAFFCVNVMQFVNHDYYIITLLPAVFFYILLFTKVYMEVRIQSVYLRRFSQITLFIYLVYAPVHASHHQVLRYQPGSFWCKDVFAEDKYDGISEYARTLGIDRSMKVISISDPSPNVSLYFMNLKGYSYNSDREQEIMQAVADPKVKFLFINKFEFLDWPVLKPYLQHQVGRYHGIMIFKIR